jgi:hypothetical protein
LDIQIWLGVSPSKLLIRHILEQRLKIPVVDMLQQCVVLLVLKMLGLVDGDLEKCW